MSPSKEQSQTRFLAIVLPCLTLCTHILLSLSYASPDAAPTHAFWSLMYNVTAAGASILGIIGGIKKIPTLTLTFTLLHTLTLTFCTLALLNILLPTILPLPLNIDLNNLLINPVTPSWKIDEDAICRDIDAGFGWDEEWLVKCAGNFYISMVVVGGVGLVLMGAQWWALGMVRRWGREVRGEGWRREGDVERGWGKERV